MSHSSNMARHARRSAQEVRSTAKRLKRTAAAESNGVLHTVQRVGSEAVGAVREGYEGLRDTAMEYADQGRDQVRSIEQSFEKRVKRNPMTSVLVATGIGFVLGMFCSRR
jgi:ElaB/YqjD/DUF883 family membrane-anchored ribosome-binding protein